MTENKKLFLSAVSKEFLAYRQLLTSDLKRPALDVSVQEDFGVIDGTTLEKLDKYMLACDGIIHLIGKATGAVPEEPAVAALLRKYPDFAAKLPPLATQLSQPQPGFSYTQWEAYLAMYHQRPLFVYRPSDFELDASKVPRDPRFVYSPAEMQSQKDHYARISALGHDRGQFLNEERLSSAVLRDLVEILPRLETTIDISATRLHHTAERLIGRDEDLDRLDAAWNNSHKNVVIVRAFGGMGKTSLVATWMAELALKNWRGAECVFDWSFYSQGTNDQRAASADIFIAIALAAFGDKDPTQGSAWDRGTRLARLVGKQRCLLVLDGLEPLQYPPGPMEGKLKDPAIEALLKGLAAQNAGLCVVTTREKVPDIQQHYGRTADDIPLTALTDLAGAALLHHHGATHAGAKPIKPDDKELQATSREVRGHGLTLQLLGQYLRLIEESGNGDILKRGTVRLADADHEYQNDATRPYGHAFKAMEAYEKWFELEGEKGERQLAVLRLLGLFDRPASKDCLAALRAEPVIAGLTEPLVGLSSRDWTVVTKRLEEINLLTVQVDGALDAHPLLREYFAMRLKSSHHAPRDEPSGFAGINEGHLQSSTDAGIQEAHLAERDGYIAFREAHRRLYEHLCTTTKDKPDATLEDLQPLYQAVAHGCQAGLQQEACDEVYYARIQRGKEAYSTNKLGAVGSDLGAIACVFQQPWNRLASALGEVWQAWLLNEAAFRLRALGRLTEAIEPMRVSGEMDVKVEEWKGAAISYSNLSELELTLGEVAAAVGDASRSVTYADRSGDAFWRMGTRTTHADALHQTGRRADAEALFREAEQMQAERQPDNPLLYSVRGFKYCDLLLAAAERAAWQSSPHALREESRTTPNATIRDDVALLSGVDSPDGLPHAEREGYIQSCHAVFQRATQTLKWVSDYGKDILSASLDHLTLGRAELYAAIIEQSQISNSKSEIEKAVSGLRRAGTTHHIPRALLTRAWLRSLTGHRTGHESSQSDLDEALEIAERGPMPLFLAEIHLYRARLFGRQKDEGRRQKEENEYPWGSVEEDLREARRLIETHGYGRRMGELEDAEGALLGKSG